MRLLHAANAAAIVRLGNFAEVVFRRICDRRDCSDEDLAFRETRADLDASYALMVTACEDLTRTTELLVTTEAERAFYASLFTEAPHALIVTTRAGIVRDANNAVALALQVPRAFLVGRPLIGFVPRGGCSAFRDLQRGADSKVQTATIRLRARHGGGVFVVSAQLCVSSMGLLLWALQPVPDAAPSARKAPAIVDGGGARSRVPAPRDES